jgi:hypothetical protein
VKVPGGILFEAVFFIPRFATAKHLPLSTDHTLRKQEPFTTPDGVVHTKFISILAKHSYHGIGWRQS